MKIAFVSQFPSIDVSYWSGIIYFMAKTLEKENELTYILDLKIETPLSLRLKKKLYNKKEFYQIDRSPEIGKGYARQIKKQLPSDIDFIFSPSSIPLAYLETDKPKVFFTDATFASMINYYPDFKNLGKRYIKEGMGLEKRALDSCQLSVYASQWAANSAINDYGADPDKVKVLPFGANIHTRNKQEEVEAFIKNRDPKECRILFLGVDWERKGGDIVLTAVKQLNAMGLPTHLDIVGISKLPVDNLPPYVTDHGRISKATPEGLKKIEDLIKSSHFLFVPSEAEAFGIVFCEAMAFGVPAISRKTGGITSIIKNDFNGIILDYNSPPEKYAHHIFNLFGNKHKYEEIALNAFRDFETRLNWETSMRAITDHIKQLKK